MITRLKRWAALGLTALALAGLSATAASSADTGTHEAPARVTRIDFDASEPFQVRARIMEVKPERGTFVVGEREICETDVDNGADRLRTSYYDLAGKPEQRHPYRVGQYVWVKGYLLPDGYVAATEIRLIDKPAPAAVPYKPIANQKNKRSRSGSLADSEQP